MSSGTNKRGCWIIGAALCLVIALFFSWLALTRLGMDYNEEGRYYDPEIGVVFHQQAAEVFGCFAIAGWMIFLVAVIALVRLRALNGRDPSD